MSRQSPITKLQILAGRLHLTEGAFRNSRHPERRITQKVEWTGWITVRKEDVSDSLAEQKLKVSIVKLRGVFLIYWRQDCSRHWELLLSYEYSCWIHLKFICPRWELQTECRHPWLIGPQFMSKNGWSDMISPCTHISSVIFIGLMGLPCSCLQKMISKALHWISR